MSTLTFLIVLQLLVAIAFFSGQVTSDGLARKVQDTERLITNACTRLVTPTVNRTRPGDLDTVSTQSKQRTQRTQRG
jgi:hypothetical protein